MSVAQRRRPFPARLAVALLTVLALGIDAAAGPAAIGATSTGADGAGAAGETYTASIAGTVTAADAEHPAGEPLEGVLVEALDRSGSPVASTTTDGRGDYTVGRLAAGRYRLKFSPLGTDFAPQWWNGKGALSSATPITVRAGQSVADRDAVLVPGARIAGTVTAGGAALPNAVVVVYDRDGAVAGYTNADADGSYAVGPLASGGFSLRVAQPWKSPFAAQWYAGAASRGSARTIDVVTGRTEQVDAIELEEGGAVTGTVAVEGGGALAGIRVLAHDRSGGDVVGRAVSASDGRYSIPNLHPGEYRLRFVSPGRGPGAGFRSEWFPDTARALSADVVTVTPGGTVAGIDGVLTELPSISGTVNGEGSPATPLAGVSVALVDPQGTELQRATTDAAGTYRLVAVDPGEDRLSFRAPPGGVWQSEWWNDQRTAAAATSLVVSRGTVLTGQDATLARKAEISGTVTGPDGRPLAGVAVRALDAEGEEFGTAVTDFDGRYGIRGLDAGRYTLAFTKAGGAYRGQYWGGATTRDDAEYLTIERGERVTGRDVRLSRDD